MVSFHKFAFLIIAMVLIFQPWYATSNIFSPIFDGLCKVMECGKGTCKRSENSTLGIACECDQGWKQISLPHDHDLKFLPCVVPNCTLNSTCMKEQLPLPPEREKPSTSTFNPCHWIDCGGGTCKRTSFFKYRCECEDGYYNLRNHHGFPCYKECAFGNNCAELGIKTANSSQPSSASNAIKEGNMKWLVSKALFYVLELMVLVICLSP